MKKFLSLILSLFIFFSLPGLALAADPNSNFEVKKGEVVDRDVFAVGENVTISGTVNGDVYAAGANVLVDGTINGDLLTAGAAITVLGTVTDDIRAAGNSVLIKGTVGKNVVAFGNNVTLGSEGKVGGSFLAGANSLDLSGPVAKDVTAYANQVTLTSRVGRNFQGAMQNLVLGGNGKIAGNLTYQSSRQANIPQGAVSGKISYKPVERQQTKNISPDVTGLKPIFFGFKFFFSVTGLLISLAVGLIYLALFPRRAEGLVNTIGTRPWASLGIGFLAFFIFPVLVILLAISLIGIPLLFLVIPLFLFFLYLAKIFTAFYLGRRILSRNDLFLPLLAGLVIYYVLGLVPVVGSLIGIIFVTIGLGAFILDLNSLRSPAKK